jgi:hypothetical protein
MTDGNTYAINQHLDEREDWDALQEVTVELEQAEARIEELESELEGRKKLMLTLAGDKIDLVSELAGIKFKLAKAIDFVAEVGGGLKFGDSLVEGANLQVLKARTLLAELTKERSDEKGETDE